MQVENKLRMNSQEKVNRNESILEGLIKKLSLKGIIKNYSFLSILISNMLIVVLAVLEKQSVMDVLWVYWFQSVIIGVFNFVRILTLKNFTVDSLKMNSKPVEKTKAAKTGVAIFFLIHYGFFHLVYAIFLTAFTSLGNLASGGVDYSFVFLTSVIFFISYLVEYIFSFTQEQESVQSLQKLMVAPYKRIFPMHLTIILSGFIIAGGFVGAMSTNISVLLIFMGLKTLIDLFTHI